MGDLRIEYMPLSKLKRAPRNPKEHDLGMLHSSIERFGYVDPIMLDENTGRLVAGHGRLDALQQMKASGGDAPARIRADGTEWLVPVIRGIAFDDEREAEAYLVADNQATILGGWDEAVLADVLADFAEDDALEGMGFDGDDLDVLLAWQAPIDKDEQARTTLAERFVVPPFSVLDARQGYWQERKRAWIALGIQSELGRGDTPGSIPSGTWIAQDLMKGEHIVGRHSGSTPPHGPRVTRSVNGSLEYEPSRGTSIFDPVLCECVYTWFSPQGGAVLDPFAGGSVRGIVAAMLGRGYVGVDLAERQVAANYAQAADIVLDALVAWHVGDARDVREIAHGDYDLLFTCPPYANLEVYSDDPRDLSTMDYPTFLEAYRHIISESLTMLRDDRFACVVVGEVRDGAGYYRGFVSDTIAAFQDAGATLYNEAILVTAVGSLPIRVGRQFDAGRKLGKTHQNVLVFVKGDWRKATEACGQIEVAWDAVAS